MSSALVLLKCVGKAALKNVGNLFGFGVVGGIAVDAWDYWKEASREERRTADVGAVAVATPVEVEVVTAEIIREEGAGLSDAERRAVLDYLRQVPALVRRSQRRPADPEGRSVRPGATFDRPDDLLSLLRMALSSL
jgi:hypothetical protein